MDKIKQATCSSEAGTTKDVLLRNNMEVGLLNNDIMAEILARVPAKPLIRFKCVSKGSNDIISSVSFGRRHSQRFKPTFSGYLLTDWFDVIKHVSISGNQITMQPLSLDFLPQKIDIVTASCNGLLCCVADIGLDDDVCIYVCNPATKEYIRVKWPEDASMSAFIGIGIIFDPVIYPTKFKLVKISGNSIPPFVFQIYCSETRRWRTIKDACYRHVHVNRVIAARGILYWMTGENAIVSFKVEKEEWKLIYLPFSGMSWDETPACSFCFGESGGCVHYICVTRYTLQVWVLDEDFKWALKHPIPLAMFGDGNKWIEPLAFTDGVLLVRVLTKLRGEIKILESIYSYHLDTTKAEELCTQHVNLPLSNLIRALPYSLSLVPLGCA